MPKVSVIVPMYNVAQYIEKCARSLFEQTLDDVEYLFINDCSPDNSQEIVERIIEEYRLRFAEEKKFARTMRMPSNSGQAAVRREGIVNATGDFVIHCDGDDWVAPDLYEKMYNKVIQSDADMVVCDLMYVYKDSEKVMEMHVEHENGKDVLADFLSNPMHMSTCNKLIKRSIFTDNNVLPIPGINMWEDNCLMYRALYYIRKIVQIHDSYYYYNQTNVSSISSWYGIKAVRQMVECAKVVTEFFESKTDAERFRKTVQAHQFYAKLNLVSDSFLRLKEYYSTFPGSESIIGDINTRVFSPKAKLRFVLVKYHQEWLVVLLFKIYNLYMRLCIRK